MNQEIVVYAVVALAALNLARIWGGSMKGQSGCGKCDGGGCGSKSKASSGVSKPAAPQLVQLQMNFKSKE